ncbi:hypothetical protein MOBT1_000860 [Malassezia obtusa]|uniref:Uncharacterized protein n=1 Tax=Malassezia obtusa TaxID=76774 RepID=A0AAF0ISH6_9BASI|nr:hypothetical protein MOBT1_000860 [Malassezia obtusa]
MPQATLEFPPVYTVVGVYRLFHDPKLWSSIWNASRYAVMRATITAGLWIVISLPFQGFLASWFVGRIGKAFGAERTYDALAQLAHAAHIPLPSFDALAKLLLILNQADFVFELNLKTQLRQFRHTAYADTVASRGKPASWWTPYTEEWQRPPSADAPRGSAGLADSVRQSLVRWVVRRVAMIVTNSIPVFGFVVYSGFSALQYARRLHAPLFEAKHMSAQQITTWIEERRTAYWLFGFSALVLERIPFLGMLFSISNRIGAAMWAHDLEKRQHRFQQGELHPLAADETRGGDSVPAAGAPGSYGHPGRADVALPGDMLAPPSQPAQATRRAVPPVPRT